MCPLGFNFSFKWWGRRENLWNAMRGSGEKLYFNFGPKEWASLYFLKSERRAVPFLMFLRAQMHIHKVDVTALYTYYCFLSADHALLKRQKWGFVFDLAQLHESPGLLKGIPLCPRGTRDRWPEANGAVAGKESETHLNPFQGPGPALWFSAKQIFPKDLQRGLPGCENTNPFSFLSSFALFLPSTLLLQKTGS